MKTVSPAEFQELLANTAGLVAFDVRTAPEYEEMHVPGVRNLPLNSLSPQALLQEGVIARDQPVYLLCRAGARGVIAAEKFAREKIAQPIVVDGGTVAWRNAHLPLALGAPAVFSLERQVRIAAGALVLLGLLLAYSVHAAFLGLSAFVGAGLVFAGITDFCGMGLLLAKLPWNQAKPPSANRVQA